ncbi:hypothetical protein ISN44_As04g010770 [Arabidopsis suecica]|uniref:Uncharacterized protein n=1 Tax=Arabidopsis suecica TaxID=45249 RepID=A0A8T2E9E5_ARASU|nr:hypothetical protein ISN44_As04g010770 [Arabidopsis suecica]
MIKHFKDYFCELSTKNDAFKVFKKKNEDFSFLGGGDSSVELKSSFQLYIHQSMLFYLRTIGANLHITKRNLIVRAKIKNKKINTLEHHKREGLLPYYVYPSAV